MTISRVQPNATSLPELTPLEIASGAIIGPRRGPPDPPAFPTTATTPRAVLEEILLSAVKESPCLVSYSGGRDSSAILALATHVARKHGLDDPVPITKRFPGHDQTTEDDWQETTVRHLGLRDWEILEMTTDLDALGPLGSATLERHGVYWPPLTHAIVPLARAAAGGVFLTGSGGDEVFSPWGWRRVSLVRRGRLRPNKTDLAWTALSLLPRPVGASYYRRTRTLGLSWLRPEALREVDRLRAARMSEWKATWATDLEYFIASRYLELGLAALQAVTADAGTRLVQPFLDPTFIRSLAAVAPREGFPRRSAGLEGQVGDLLPPAVTRRSTKAVFTDVLWGPASEQFAAQWNGEGLDDSLVDPDELRRVWMAPRRDFRSVTALQTAWLSTRARLDESHTFEPPESAEPGVR